jgi:hypothetical protein
VFTTILEETRDDAIRAIHRRAALFANMERYIRRPGHRRLVHTHRERAMAALARLGALPPRRRASPHRRRHRPITQRRANTHRIASTSGAMLATSGAAISTSMSAAPALRRH